MELADLLSERDIQELARPTGEASGLPGHAYGVGFFWPRDPPAVST